jgi:hypothetical protein
MMRADNWAPGSEKGEQNVFFGALEVIKGFWGHHNGEEVPTKLNFNHSTRASTGMYVLERNKDLNLKFSSVA